MITQKDKPSDGKETEASGESDSAEEPRAGGPLGGARRRGSRKGTQALGPGPGAPGSEEQASGPQADPPESGDAPATARPRGQGVTCFGQLSVDEGDPSLQSQGRNNCLAGAPAGLSRLSDRLRLGS